MQPFVLNEAVTPSHELVPLGGREQESLSERDGDGVVCGVRADRKG
jgi:hypothetical protein